MQGKTVLVVGANGGLGVEVTKAFLAAGAIVVGAARKIQGADFQHPQFHAEPADITDAGAVRELVQTVAKKYGRIDVLVHVAGGFAAGKLYATDDETWRRMLDLNLSAAFFVSREVVKHMRENNGGRLIAIGSLAAAEPHAGIGAYVVTKTALNVLYRTIALENQDKNITANVVLPGTMDTSGNRESMPNADRSKWVQPSDVAEVVLFLAVGEGSASINGALVPVTREL